MTKNIDCELFNLRWLLPMNKDYLTFRSIHFWLHQWYSTEIWSRDQFFHENQLCNTARVKFGWNKGWKRGKTCFLSDFVGVSSHCVTSNSFPFNLRYLEYKVGLFVWYQAYLNPESCQNISSTFWFIAILVLGLNYS